LKRLQSHRTSSVASKETGRHYRASWEHPCNKSPKFREQMTKQQPSINQRSDSRTNRFALNQKRTSEHWRTLRRTRTVHQVWWRSPKKSY
jgi:hypothetical protein